jgi:hypothetical protein
VDETVFDKIFSVAAAAWAAVAMLAVRLFHTWPNVMARINERKRDTATEKADDWQRIRDERDHAIKQVETLRGLLTKCETERIEWMSRAVTAESQILGIGMGRQQVAEIEAAKRIIKDDKAQGGGK